MKEIPIKDRLIFALDVATLDAARRWLDLLGNHVTFYKVGLQLFLAAGWPVIEEILERGHNVMLDLKFFDIPETVQNAVTQLQDKGITFATVHGNEPIIKAAVAAKGPVKILAVTVLTSFDESDLRAMGLTGTVEELVLRRAKKAVELGCNGVVASAKEAKVLRKDLGDSFIIVTPGIRPGINGSIQTDDQKRVTTAIQAIRDGSDYVVIGRPISKAKDPIKVVSQVQKEIEEGLKKQN